MNILCNYEKKVIVHFFCVCFCFCFSFGAFLENTCFVCNSYGEKKKPNVSVEGAITSVFKHYKEYYSKNAHNCFSNFSRKYHTTILEHNEVDPIGGLDLKV